MHIDRWLTSRHIHPHHQPLPAQYQTTDKGRADAEEYYNRSSAMAPSKLTLTDLLTLPNSSVQIPRLGFGIYQSPPNFCINSCLTALKAGYRHIDSAQFYQNESEMGEAARQSGLPRSSLFLATKVMSSGGSPDATYKKCLDSVNKIDGENGYVDLFLIHTPSGGPAARKEMWQALEKLENEGRAKSIGVSNHGVGHIEEMKSYARIWPPHVNQIEVSWSRPPLPHALSNLGPPATPMEPATNDRWLLQQTQYNYRSLLPTCTKPKGPWRDSSEDIKEAWETHGTSAHQVFSAERMGIVAEKRHP